MQTNLSVQTMQTSIRAIGSTSKGRGAGGERGICKSVITQSKDMQLIIKLPNLSCLLDVDPMVQIEVYTVCMERLVCTWYIPFILSEYQSTTFLRKAQGHLQKFGVQCEMQNGP